MISFRDSCEHHTLHKLPSEVIDMAVIRRAVGSDRFAGVEGSGCDILLAARGEQEQGKVSLVTAQYFGRPSLFLPTVTSCRLL